MVHRRSLVSNFRLTPRDGVLRRTLAVLAVASGVALALAASSRGHGDRASHPAGARLAEDSR